MKISTQTGPYVARLMNENINKENKKNSGLGKRYMLTLLTPLS